MKFILPATPASNARRAISLAPARSGPQARLAPIGALAGRSDEARQALVKLERLASDQHVAPPTAIAGIDCALGEKDRTLDWLERTDQERDTNLAELKITPVFERVPSERRYRDLLRRIGLPP